MLVSDISTTKNLTIGTDSMQQLVDKVMSELVHLKTFYIFVCPAQKLSIKSKSLEKLCIYKSEHVELHSLDLPKLKILMLQGDLIELVYKAHQVLYLIASSIKSC